MSQGELGGCSCPAGWMLNLLPATLPNHMAPPMQRSLWANWAYCGRQDVWERMQFSTGYLSKTGQENEKQNKTNNKTTKHQTNRKINVLLWYQFHVVWASLWPTCNSLLALSKVDCSPCFSATHRNYLIYCTFWPQSCLGTGNKLLCSRWYSH